MGDHAPPGRGLTASPADIFPPRDIAPEPVEAARKLFAAEFRFVAGAANPALDGTYSIYGKPSPNGAGSVRMRFGYVADQWMPYATGGFAYASGTPTTTVQFCATGSTCPPFTAQGNAVKTVSTNGWTAGAGVEYGVMSNFSVKLEWLYYQFGHGQRSVGSCTGIGCNLFYGAGRVVDVYGSHNSAEINEVRLGANYLFNWP